MRKIILASMLALSLAGCKHKPDTGLARPPEIPALPANLAKPAESLPQLKDPTMGGQALDGSLDDQQYNEVAHQLNKVIQLYNCVREAINTKTQPETCLGN